MLDNEVQVKIRINDFQNTKKILVDKGCVFLGGWREKIIRFDTKDKELKEKGKFLRVKIGNENVVTLKENRNYENNKFFEMSNSKFQIDDVESLCYVLKAIGLNNTYVMEKYRLLWMYKDIEFYINELPFGVFLEINSEDKNINKIIKLLKINAEQLIKVTYWEIYEDLKSKDIKYQNKDIVFDKNHIFKIATI